jgi:hypothetical protein
LVRCAGSAQFCGHHPSWAKNQLLKAGLGRLSMKPDGASSRTLPSGTVSATNPSHVAEKPPSRADEGALRRRAVLAVPSCAAVVALDDPFHPRSLGSLQGQMIRDLGNYRPFQVEQSSLVHGLHGHGRPCYPSRSASRARVRWHAPSAGADGGGVDSPLRENLLTVNVAVGEEAFRVAGRGHPSGTPALRMSLMIRSRPFRKSGLSLCAPAS